MASSTLGEQRAADLPDFLLSGRRRRRLRADGITAPVAPAVSPVFAVLHTALAVACSRRRAVSLPGAGPLVTVLVLPLLCTPLLLHASRWTALRGARVGRNEPTRSAAVDHRTVVEGDVVVDDRAPAAVAS
ncbi:hypothetical protein ACI8AF_00960 [Blastococcus sp. SYSU D00669]